MNSLERKEQRYQRRKNKRLKKNQEDSDKYCNLDNIFNFHKCLYYADRGCRAVGFKKSTQNFKLHLFTIVATTCRNIKNNTYKVSSTYRFKLNERGKIRIIDAPHIKDRLVHKILSNEVLIPIYSKHLIYDNGVNLKNKGFSFSLKRLKKKLYSLYRRDKNNGYILFIDFSKYFEIINHEIVKFNHIKYIKNNKVIKILEDYLFINKGLSLGVEIAQVEAIMYPNILDHYIDNMGCLSVRYMDDFICFVKNKEDAIKIFNNYKKITNKLGIIINEKKSTIKKINSFVFCKWKYMINSKGKIILKPIYKTLRRQRIKLKKLYNMGINSKEIDNIFKSFLAYKKL